MLRSLRRRLTYANAVSTFALFLVLAGGTALATHPGGTNTISSGDIINGQVRTPDLRDAEVTAPKLAQNSVGAGKIVDGGVTVADIATGAVRTDELANGQVQAEDLAPGVAPGASGARAYGLVSSDGSLSRAKNIAGVSHNDGSPIYCVDPGGGIVAGSAVLIVAPNGSDNGTVDGAVVESSSVVEWRPSNPICAAGTLEVVTYVHDGDELDNVGAGDNLPGDDVRPEPEGFTFVIP